MLTKEDLVVLVRQEIDDASGYDSDILASKRAAALQYYHGAMPAAAEGRSQIVSKDVADSVHALLAMINPIFQSSMITFAPAGEDDEQNAQLESNYVKYMLDRSDGWKLLSEAAHDALLIGNGWLKCTVEPTTERKTENYPPLDDLQLMKVMEATAENQEVAAAEVKDGYRITRDTTTYNLVVECIAPDVMLFSAQVGQFGLDDLRFVGERKLLSVSDLKGMGAKDIDSMPDSEDDWWPAIIAREGLYADEGMDSFATQRAEKLKECFDVYMRVDMEENGTSELRHMLVSGSVMITDEPTECIPYATGSPCPVPHRIQGTGMFELMGSVQAAKTTALRNFLDNLEVANGSRVGAVEGKVNLTDLTSGRINGVVRIKSPDAIVPLPAMDIGPQSIQGLTYLDTVRSQRGGASLDMNNADRQVMASSATAAGGVMETAERMAGWYAGNLVNTLLKGVYNVIHKTLRYNMPETVTARLDGKWVETNPSQWPERAHIEVVAGLTSRERNQKITGLTQVIQKLEQVIVQGGEGVITNKSKLFGAYADWVRAADIGAPDEYLLNPDDPEQQAVAKRQQEGAEKDAEHQQSQIDRIAQMEQQIEQQKLELDRYKHDSDLKFKYYDADLDAEVNEAKMVADSVVQLKQAGNNES